MLSEIAVVVVGLVLSLGIGLLLGLLGGGGSILAVPLLRYAFGLPAHAAIATSLIVVAVTSAVAVIPHARRGYVDWRVGVIFASSSMITAFGAARLGGQLPGTLLMVGFGLVMITVGILTLVRKTRPSIDPARPLAAVRVCLIGIGVGALTGLFGAGGGFLIVPALVLVGGLSTRQAIGTSLLVICVNAAAGFAGASHAGFDPSLALGVAALAVAGCLVGSRISARVEAHHLQQLFGGFVTATAFVLLLHEII